MKIGSKSIGIAIAGTLLLCSSIQAKEREAAKTAPAKLRVDGLGFFGNRGAKREALLAVGSNLSRFDATDLEDVALVVISKVRGSGYLGVSAELVVNGGEGENSRFAWGSDLDTFLPRELLASNALLDVRKGPRHYYGSLEFEGSSLIDDGELAMFFYEESLLFQTDRSRVFTRSLFNGSMANVEAHLRSLGFQDARVSGEVTNIDSTIGAVSARVKIADGIAHRVREVEVVVDGEDVGLQFNWSRFVGQPYSRFLVQDLERELRASLFANGYADHRVIREVQELGRTELEASIGIAFRVEPGLQWKIGSVAFGGAPNTKRSVLERLADVEEGSYFNPVQIDESRLELARLGIFEEVSYRAIPTSEHSRSIEFSLTERDPWKLDTVVGYGSYERFRFGVSAERLNLFGRAHRARFDGIVSMKSVLGEFGYLMPEIFGARTSAVSKLAYLDREEVSFDHEEIGLDVGLSRRFEKWNLDFDTLYVFRTIEDVNTNADRGELIDERQDVGSVEFRVGRDQRDNPLNPRTGYRLFGRFELASEFLGGESDYQRMEVGYSAHGKIKGGLYWHVGFAHGAVGSIDGSQSQVPISKLFYPGGENSVRGYRYGEAAPRDSEGGFVGASSYLQGNFELEQQLTPSFSAVLFYDAVGTSEDIETYPVDETLSSIGIGIRLRTFMGPVRFEYGHNLDQRVEDPPGAFHLSIGYPF